MQTLYEELLKDVKGVHIHKQPADARYDANFWLCAATLDPEVRIQGQENAYKEVVKTAVGGAAGVIHQVDSATTDCQPNENVEALRVFMLRNHPPITGPGPSDRFRYPNGGKYFSVGASPFE